VATCRGAPDKDGIGASRCGNLYLDLDDDTPEAEELAAIEAGEINATSFCYVGAVASKRSAFTR
jgi:hypothetical protein